MRLLGLSTLLALGACATSGAPDARSTAAAGLPAAEEARARSSDVDGDGLRDREDKCPHDPETPNGYMDDDGCPDLSSAVGGIDDWYARDRREDHLHGWAVGHPAGRVSGARRDRAGAEDAARAVPGAGAGGTRRRERIQPDEAFAGARVDGADGADRARRARGQAGGARLRIDGAGVQPEQRAVLGARAAGGVRDAEPIEATRGRGGQRRRGARG